MIDIPKIEYVYAKRIDWKETLLNLAIGDTRLCELTDSQYTMLCVARKDLKKLGVDVRLRHVYSTRAYVIERLR